MIARFGEVTENSCNRMPVGRGPLAPCRLLPNTVQAACCGRPEEAITIGCFQNTGLHTACGEHEASGSDSPQQP